MNISIAIKLCFTTILVIALCNAEPGHEIIEAAIIVDPRAGRVFVRTGASGDTSFFLLDFNKGNFKFSQSNQPF